VLTLLCSFGDIASYAELLERFHGQTSAIAPFRRSDSGLIYRLRSNVFVCSHLDDDERAAARIGGLLDCTTVLRRAGALPGADDGHLHLRLSKNDGRASARRRNEPRAIRAHWHKPSWPAVTLDSARHAFERRDSPLSRLELPLREALRQALTSCLTPQQSRDALVLLIADALTPEDAAEVLARTPRRVQSQLRRIGLPTQLNDALERLERGNIFDAW